MKRRPKGMGSVSFLGKGRRKPYVATLSKKCIGTFKTEPDAEKSILFALIDKNNLFPDYISLNHELKYEYIEFIYEMQQKKMLPDDISEFPDMSLFDELLKSKLLSSGKILEIKQNIIIADTVPTFEEIWIKERDRLMNSRSKSWYHSMNTAFRHFKSVHSKKINIVSSTELQSCFDIQMEKGSGESKLINMKNVCNIIFMYAKKERIISKNDDPTEYIEYKSTSEKSIKRRVFTITEITKLINDSTDISKITLLFILTGMRPSELLDIPRSDIHINEKYLIGGIKTKAGKGRTVPLHDVAIPIVEYFLKQYDYDYLCYPRNAQYSYDIYREQFHELMKRLKLNHDQPYDTRHSFATLAKTARMDEGVRRLILGHDRKDITDKTYTHEPLEFLLEEINKIKIC